MWRSVGILIILFFTFQFLRLLITAIYNVYLHPLRKVHGPQLWVAFPLIRNYHMIHGDLDYIVKDFHERWGDVVRLGPNLLSFTSAAAWKDIYGHGHAELPKSLGNIVDEKKIFAANAANHFRYRRAMLPAFSEKALAQQESLMLVYVDLLMVKLREAVQKGGQVDMVRFFTFTTFDLIADLTYGVPLQGLAEGKSNDWIETMKGAARFLPVMILASLFPVVGTVLKLIASPKMRNSRARHEEYCTKLTMDRITRKEHADRGDFMDYIMRSRGEKHELSDEELVANCDFLMVAGSDTTASLLSGVTFWLLKTPSALKKVVEEVRAAFENDEDITFRAATAKLPYLLACLDEGLRIFPPVPLMLARHTLPGPPTPIAGLLVPENTRVGVNHFAAYHSHRNFHRAHEYIPERWLPESTQDPQSPFYNDKREVHKPFSFGPRDCIGRNLAYHEMRLIMTKLLWHFDLIGLAPESLDWNKQNIILGWEKPPLNIVLRERVQ
ncbi:cytochrome P450 [Whalleya microplaca]|nr:cytochrome P450 [Whalleya microplaca]